MAVNSWMFSMRMDGNAPVHCCCAACISHAFWNSFGQSGAIFACTNRRISTAFQKLAARRLVAVCCSCCDMVQASRIGLVILLLAGALPGRRLGLFCGWLRLISLSVCDNRLAVVSCLLLSCVRAADWRAGGGRYAALALLRLRTRTQLPLQHWKGACRRGRRAARTSCSCWCYLPFARSLWHFPAIMWQTFLHTVPWAGISLGLLCWRR